MRASQVLAKERIIIINIEIFDLLLEIQYLDANVTCIETQYF